MPTPITSGDDHRPDDGYRSDFQAGMSMAPSQYQKIAMTIAVHVEIQHLRLAGAVPAVP